MATLTLKKTPSQEVLTGIEKNKAEVLAARIKRNYGRKKAMRFLMKFPVFRQRPPLRLKTGIRKELVVLKNEYRKGHKFSYNHLKYAITRYASLAGYPLDGPRFDLNCEEVDENLYT